MKNNTEIPVGHSVKRTVLRFGMLLGLITSIVVIARLITGRNRNL